MKIPHSDNLFADWTHKYPLSKTLRFELKPLSEPDFLSQFIESDRQRNKDYKELKEIIDQYHKEYIAKSLSNNSILNLEDIKEIDQLYIDKKKLKEYNEKEKIKNKITKLENKLRKQVVENFKAKKSLFDQKLLKELLPEWLKTANVEKREHKQEIVKKFERFSTYLTGFHTNRKNIYSDKEQSTAISHRIINENLPKFLSNKEKYEKIVKYGDLREKLNPLNKKMSEDLSYFKIKNIEEIFKLDFFNQCLSQKSIDYYNSLIGGKTLKNRQKIKGLNEIINQYRQKNQLKRNQLPDFEILYKQILSDREKLSFLPEEFETSKDLSKAVESFWKEVSQPRDWNFQQELSTSSLKDSKKSKIQTNSENQLNLLNAIKTLFTTLSEDQYDLSQIYFERSRLSNMSLALFKDWSFIERALEHYIDDELQIENEIKDSSSQKNKKVKKLSKSKIEKNKKQFLNKDFYSFQEINKALLSYRKFLDDEEMKQKIKTDQNNILFYFQSAFSDREKNSSKPKNREELLKELKTFFEDKNLSKSDLSESILPKPKLPEPELLKNFYDVEISKILQLDSNKTFSEKEIESLKVFLDSLQSFAQIMRSVLLEKNRKKVEMDEKDAGFYNSFDELYPKISTVISLYNKCRNFIAKNKDRLKKIKINFENSTLLDGWDLNQERANTSVLLRKKQKGRWIYYLAVMDKKNNSLFDYHLNFDDHKKTKIIEKKQILREKILVQKPETEHYEKMNYKLLPDPSKMLPKVFFSKQNLSLFSPDENILKIKETKTYAKNDGSEFNLSDCHKLIDFYKKSITNHYDWNKFGFQFSPTSTYKDISDFYYEISSQGYRISFDKIRSDYIEENLKSGKLYLFQIYNKDFSDYSKGKPNLHTSYFRMLFDEKNLKDTVFKLNGQAEIFYRKASLERRISHKKNQAIKNKNSLNPKKESTFAYDLIKDKRYTEDKFFFHFPITLNFKSRSSKNFNSQVLSFLKNNPKINIIGIDRGERHLAYYTVINQRGAILEQGSFNKISTFYKPKTDKQDKSLDKKAKNFQIERKTNYHELLEIREKDRDKSRKSWGKIENIKELKSGYLSQVVHKVSQLMIYHNAIVVFEDLNRGFKRGRMKFEKQVYQKLEKALIDKLNYLVFKDRNQEETGGYLKGYQLTAEFESFQKLGKQTGFIFYVPAYWTSKVDPKTGFVNLIHPKYENIEKSKNFFKKFDKIFFDQEKDYFVFEYTDSKVNPIRKLESDASWTVCTHGKERYKYDWKNKKHIPIHVTQKLKDLFKKYKITYQKENNLIESICQNNEKDFFFNLIDLLKLTLQLRHIHPEAKTDKERDFILSPVCCSGHFFDSRKALKTEPQNADANGAYHIALKGLKNLKDLSKQSSDKLKIYPLKNKDWFDFLSKKNKKNRKWKKSS